MKTITIQLPDVDYLRLKNAANQVNKSVQAFIYEWIVQLPETEGIIGINQESVFQFGGYESDTPHRGGLPIISSDTPIELDGDYY